MIIPAEIAEAAHKICTEILIPKGLSPKHPVTQHNDTTRFYAQVLNERGIQASPEEIVNAIVGDWDKDSPWKGHPDPEIVIERLNNNVS